MNTWAWMRWPLCAVGLTTLLASACGPDSTGGGGVVSVPISVTRSGGSFSAALPRALVTTGVIDPANVAALSMQVDAVELHTPGSGWQRVVLSAPVRLDLLALPTIGVGTPLMLGTVAVVPGPCQVRLFVSAPVIRFNQAVEVGQARFEAGLDYSMEIPSGEQSGLKAEGECEVPASGAGVTLVFGVASTVGTIVATGSGKLLVTPVVRLGESVVTTVRWINPNGGDWNTASNWSTGVLPTADQDVIIDIAVTNPITHSAGTTQIKSLTSTQPFMLSGGALTISGPLQIDNDVSFTGGSLTTGGEITLNVPGNLTVNSAIDAGTNALTFNVAGSISQAGGSVTAGTAILNAASGITLTNVAVTSLTASNTSSGTVTITDVGGLTLNSVTNPNGSVTMSTTGSLVVNGNVSSGTHASTLMATGGAISQTAGALTGGALTLNAATGINFTSTSISALQATNTSGAVSVLDATANLDIVGTGVTNGGNVTLATSGTLSLTGNVTATGSTANLTSGTVMQAGGTVNATSLVLNTATGATLTNLAVSKLTATNTTSGNLSLSTTGFLSIVGIVNPGGSITVFTPGNINVAGNVYGGANNVGLVSSASIDQTGGTLTAGTLDLDAASGITLTNVAPTTLMASNTTTGAISITGPAGALNVGAAGIRNDGGDVTVASTGALTLTGDVTVQGSRAVSLSGGTIASTGGQPVANTLHLVSVNGVTLTNLVAPNLSAMNTAVGSIDLGVLANVTIVAPGLTNSGGSITLNAAGSLTIPADVNATSPSLSLRSTSLVISADGNVISTGGTIETGDLTNGGTLSLGASGHASVAGVFVNTASGVLNVDIGGTATTEFSRFTISGTAIMDGTLNAALVTGFVPAPGDRYQFMTFGSRTGFFSTTTLPPNFTVDQSDPTDLEFVVAALLRSPR